MGLFETLNRLGVLSVGRRPEWKVQANTTGPPASAGAGVSIAGSVKTLVSITLEDATEDTEATAYIYLLAGGIGSRPPQWTLARNGTLTVDVRGLTERLDTAGFDRMYVEVVADGNYEVHVGPGVVE